MQNPRRVGVIAISVVVTATLTVLAPPVMADPSSGLRQAVDQVRSASSCPPLQSDPMVERVAQMAMQNTDDYVGFRTAAVPFTDPMPALKTIGYRGSRAILLSGYGKNDVDAIHGLILQGLDPIRDCSYSQYGVSAMRDDAGFNLTSVVLAGQDA